ncbi:hypothetical protein COCON_G00075490 [Conger conger]|uniref:Uncharacterized protein n=1 Tax=Conger conger TaxID=82655 RepID=A0A9Q1I207_CONCO|nr:hypothetical protein COCON_G00075490 [Conger conger]
MDVLTVAALLSLLSVSAAKPLGCEDLIQPLPVNKTHVSGKWIVIEGTADHQSFIDIQKTVNSSLIDTVLSSDESTAVMKDRNMMNGKCHYGVQNVTFSNNTGHMIHESGLRTCTVVLHASPDCLVVSLTSVLAEDIIKSLYIFGRTKQLSQADLDIYHKQVECLGFPQPMFKYDQKQDICPAEEKALS